LNLILLNTSLNPVAREKSCWWVAPDAKALTAYIVQRCWGDARNQVWVSVDGVAPVFTVP
jgi:hypothetical protein